MVQRYFGLHYTADTMPLVNEDYLEVLEESGFQLARSFTPVDK